MRWCDNIRDHHIVEVASTCPQVHSFDLGVKKKFGGKIIKNSCVKKLRMSLCLQLGNMWENG